jgi:hypothetical protein
MAKITDVTFVGKSKTSYTFEAYAFGTEFHALGAVYIFSVRTVTNGKGSHDPIYIGETGDLSERFDQHHKAKCIKAKNPNCICIHLEEDGDTRLAIEMDLLGNRNPPCNG